MADTNTNKPQSGFTLPPPTSSPTPAPSKQMESAGVTGAGTTLKVDMGSTGASSRDMIVGGAILLVLMIAFFFAKNAYANMLVGKRVEPRSANAAGWWLWVFLTLLSVAVVLAAISSSVLMTPYIVGPLGLGAIVAFVLMLMSSKR